MSLDLAVPAQESTLDKSKAALDHHAIQPEERHQAQWPQLIFILHACWCLLQVRCHLPLI